jgi:hypothetical protein
MPGISLGWNCYSASNAVLTGLRATKANSYNTCPFDEALTNYDGVVECIRDDFRHFLDVELIDTPDDSDYMANETVIYNPYYKFIFNHESPGHANLWKKQMWPGGKTHYIENDFKLFKERYIRRITNFKNYLTSANHIDFIITKQTPCVQKLDMALRETYPDLKYTIHRLELELGEKHYYAHLKLMGYSISELISL